MLIVSHAHSEAASGGGEDGGGEGEGGGGEGDGGSGGAGGGGGGCWQTYFRRDVQVPSFHLPSPCQLNSKQSSLFP
eukprot:scaffold133442_cov102-Phaeocystis_antarctica.AAC.1